MILSRTYWEEKKKIVLCQKKKIEWTNEGKKKINVHNTIVFDAEKKNYQSKLMDSR